MDMSDFSLTWELSRGRFDAEVAGLTHEQLVWNLYPGAHSIGHMAMHVAGVEVYFISQLLGLELSDEDKRLASAAVDGVVNDNPLPYSDSEITPEFVKAALDRARALVAPVITAAEAVVREKEIVSALGPVITGAGAFARLGMHPLYHQGQVYQIKQAPGFPS